MVALGMILAQALAAQAPSSSPAAAVAPSTETVVVSTPAPLRAPVLLRQEVAFASTEAVRIEWETDLSAIGEVRYGTAAPLAFSAKAPVYSPSQSVTFDATGFPAELRLYYQISWTDRLGLGGMSDLRPVAAARPTAQEPRLVPPPAPKPVEVRKAEWLVFAGPIFRGRDVGWNAGGAFRPASLPLEAAVEAGVFRHQRSRIRDLRSASPGLEQEQTSKLRFTYARARADYLYRIQRLRDPFGEPLVAFPGYLRAGAGVALYEVRHIHEDHYAPSNRPDYEDIQRRTNAAPFVEAAVVRKIGWKLELSFSATYTFDDHDYGIFDLGFGGAEFLVQLGYRFK